MGGRVVLGAVMAAGVGIATGGLGAALRGAFRGALSSDAAALGFHWLYKVDALDAAVAAHGGRVEFETPDEKDYQGRVGYLAHRGKVSGDVTQFGSVLDTELRTIAGTEDKTFSPEAFKWAIVGDFGFGGKKHVFVDGGVRDTLVSYYSKPDVDVNTPQGSEKDAEITFLGRLVVVLAAATTSDKTDAQIVDDTVWALTFTQRNVAALVYARFAAACTLAAAKGGDASLAGLEAAVKAGIASLDAFSASGIGAEEAALAKEAATRIEAAWAKGVADAAGEVDGSTLGADDADAHAKHRAYALEIGQACASSSALPLAVHSLALYASRNASPRDAFLGAIRGSILAGGNNAGRNTFIGGVFGAAHPSLFGGPDDVGFWTRTGSEDDRSRWDAQIQAILK